jgi:hypothetical protein
VATQHGIRYTRVAKTQYVNVAGPAEIALITMGDVKRITMKIVVRSNVFRTGGITLTAYPSEGKGRSLDKSSSNTSDILRVLSLRFSRDTG